MTLTRISRVMSFGTDNQWTYDLEYNAHVFFLSMPEGMGNVERVKNLRIQRWFDHSSNALVIKFAVYNRIMFFDVYHFLVFFRDGAQAWGVGCVPFLFRTREGITSFFVEFSPLFLHKMWHGGEIVNLRIGRRC